MVFPVVNKYQQQLCRAHYSTRPSFHKRATHPRGCAAGGPSLPGGPRTVVAVAAGGMHTVTAVCMVTTVRDPPKRRRAPAHLCCSHAAPQRICRRCHRILNTDSTCGAVFRGDYSFVNAFLLRSDQNCASAGGPRTVVAVLLSHRKIDILQSCWYIINRAT